MLAHSWSAWRLVGRTERRTCGSRRTCSRWWRRRTVCHRYAPETWLVHHHKGVWLWHRFPRTSDGKRPIYNSTATASELTRTQWYRLVTLGWNSMVLRSVIEHNRYLVGVNSNAFCLIVTRFFLAVIMRSLLSWKVFMTNRFPLHLLRLE